MRKRSTAAFTLVLALVAGCDDPPLPLPIDDLIVISGTQDGRLLQLDAASGEVRSVALGLPPFDCGATADVAARDLYTARHSHSETGFTLFRIDLDAGRIARKRGSAELAQAASVELLQPVGVCPMVLAGGLLYTALGRTGDGYIIVALDPRNLAPVHVLEPVAVIPHALVATGPLSDAPEGAVLVQGLPADTLGQPVRGAGRIVGFDLATGARLPRLDIDFDAPYGFTAAVADIERGRVYAEAYPSLLVIDLEPPVDTATMAAASPGPLAIGGGLLFQAATGPSVQVRGSGQVYYYDLAGVLYDSVDVQPASLDAPPYVRGLSPDSMTDYLFLYAGTGEGGLFYDLQRARVLFVDIASRALVREIPLDVWSAGRMLVFH